MSEEELYGWANPFGTIPEVFGAGAGGVVVTPVGESVQTVIGPLPTDPTTAPVIEGFVFGEPGPLNEGFTNISFGGGNVWEFAAGAIDEIVEPVTGLLVDITPEKSVWGRAAEGLDNVVEIVQAVPETTEAVITKTGEIVGKGIDIVEDTVETVTDTVGVVKDFAVDTAVDLKPLLSMLPMILMVTMMSQMNRR